MFYFRVVLSNSWFGLIISIYVRFFSSCLLESMLPLRTKSEGDVYLSIHLYYYFLIDLQPNFFFSVVLEIRIERNHALLSASLPASWGRGCDLKAGVTGRETGRVTHRPPRRACDAAPPLLYRPAT